MVEYRQIPLKDLKVGCWYIGRGRRANIGLWNGDNFEVIGYGDTPTGGKLKAYKECDGGGIWHETTNIYREDYYYETKEDYIKENGEEPIFDLYGSFQPFLKVDFGKTIEEIEENGSGGGYGKRIRFKQKE